MAHGEFETLVTLLLLFFGASWVWAVFWSYRLVKHLFISEEEKRKVLQRFFWTDLVMTFAVSIVVWFWWVRYKPQVLEYLSWITRPK